MWKPGKSKKSKTLRLLVVIFAIILSFSFLAISIYISTPYKAGDSSKVLLNSIVTKKINSQTLYLFPGLDPKSNQTYLIYPGGRVEAGAYSELCSELAKISKGCIIEQMRFNFAFLPRVDLETIINKTFLKESEVTVIGHSLGGPFLARDLLKTDLEKNNIKNFVLLGSFSDVNISDLDVQVYSLIGENDILIGDSVDKNIKNLPQNTIFIEVPGGNHSGWGDYGQQSGDGESSITNSEQRRFLIDLFRVNDNHNQE